MLFYTQSLSKNLLQTYYSLLIIYKLLLENTNLNCRKINVINIRFENSSKRILGVRISEHFVIPDLVLLSTPWLSICAGFPKGICYKYNFKLFKRLMSSVDLIRNIFVRPHKCWLKVCKEQLLLQCLGISAIIFKTSFINNELQKGKGRQPYYYSFHKANAFSRA